VGETEQGRSRYGVICGIAAYGLWGLFPLYFEAVAQIAPVEILAHRAVWSFVVLAVLVGVVGRWGELWRKLHSGKLLLLLGVSTCLIATNWLLYIYAIESHQVVQASLGYFVNPLVNVLLGVMILGERLRPRQIVSIALVTVGVLILTSRAGQFPWLALALASTFALYGMMRKIIPLDSLLTLAVETLFMTPIALAYLGYLGTASHISVNHPATMLLLMLSGPVTTVPLLFFGAATKRLRLSTLGILQYLSPTLQFLLAVLVFREPLSSAQLLSFACIWTAILLYVTDSLRLAREGQIEIIEPD